MTEESGAEPRRLSRSEEGRLITGVCAGLARYTRIDPVVFRVAFALLVITTGVGVALYIGAFLLMAAPGGGPSKIERLARRVFDGDTVLALLGAALGAGMLLGVIGSWGSGDGLAVVVVFALTLFVARSRGADLVQVARSLPEHVKGRPLSSWTPPMPSPPPYRLPEGMIDLARLGRRAAPPGSDPHPTDPYTTGPYAARPRAADPRSPEAPAAPPTGRPYRRSWLTALTLTAAALVSGVLYASAGDRPGFDRIQIILAGALAVVAAGLFLGAWLGRDRKLITVGAIMSLALASTSIAGDPAIAKRAHTRVWRPAGSLQAEQSHKVFIGEGVVDLTRVPLSPGQRLNVSAEVTLGVLDIKVPRTARLEVDGQAFLGDITVDRQITSGPRARVRRVLEPEGRTDGAVPTIVLHIRSKVGDMEVTRVPA